jgi:hypothetical protein
MLTLEVDWLQVTTTHGKICMIQAVTCVSFPLKKWLHDRMAATSLSLPAVVTSPTEAARTKVSQWIDSLYGFEKNGFPAGGYVMKPYTLAILGVGIVAGISLATWAGAVNQGDKEALNAFKQMEEARGRHNKSLRNESANYRLSDFSIQGAELPDVEEILSYEGSTMTDLLLPSDEKLSFILDGNQVKGFTLATDTRPIMAGESGSELFELHEKIKAELGEDVNLTYVFYAGGFIFVAVDPKGQESVWLDRRAATILNVSPSTPYAPEEILEHIQKGAKAAVTSKSKSKPEEL